MVPNYNRGNALSPSMSPVTSPGPSPGIVFSPGSQQGMYSPTQTGGRYSPPHEQQTSPSQIFSPNNSNSNNSQAFSPSSMFTSNNRGSPPVTSPSSYLAGMDPGEVEVVEESTEASGNAFFPTGLSPTLGILLYYILVSIKYFLIPSQ